MRAIDLAIVDMHMPPDEGSVEIDERAGVLCLGWTLQFMNDRCATVIFTAYPSYEDCVEVVKNGADAYIPKVTVSGKKSNLDLLEAACKKALARSQEPEHEVPSSNWLAANYAWLCQQYGGKWVVLVAKDQAESAGLDTRQPDRIRDGLFVIAGDSYNGVRQQISANPALWQKASAIALLPKSERH